MKRTFALLLLPLFGGCDGNLADTLLLIATTERVSLDSSGAEVFGSSQNAAISADGRIVAFQSSSANLVPGDTNATVDVFARDTVLGTTTRVSVEAPGTIAFPDGPDGVADGNDADGFSGQPAVSADGRFVAFQSDAIDLITDAPGTGLTDIYVRDLLNGATTLVSHAAGGGFANGASSSASLSPDGRFIAFVSVATDLTADVVSGTTQHVFVWDRNSGLVELVSKHPAGAVGNSDSNQPAVSQTGSNGANGVFVVFSSAAGNLVTGAGAATPVSHVFRKAIPAGAAEMVDAVPAPSSGTSQNAFITPDGRFVAFRSAGTNLSAVDVNGQDDIFVRDMIAPAGLLPLVSQLPSGIQGGGGSSLPTLSPDGRFVTFVSSAPNLVSGDSNGSADLFWRDLQSTGPASLQRVNVATFGQQSAAGASSGFPGRAVMSADGRFVVFHSSAADLVNGDTNGSTDVFVRGPLR